MNHSFKVLLLFCFISISQIAFAQIEKYESGIKTEPTNAANYYHAALLYSKTEQEIWALLYGEIFIDLEPNSKSTEDISKMLSTIYSSQVTIKSDANVAVSFYNPTDSDIENEGKMEFGTKYEAIFLLSTFGEKKIDLSSLDRIRTNFLKIYFEMGYPVKFPNVLFDYQKKIYDAGHMEAYNHYLLQMGDFEGFEKWKRDNAEKWSAFQIWFVQNPLKLDADHKFYSGQY